MNKWLKIITISGLISIVMFFALPLTVQASQGERGLFDRIVAGGDFTLTSKEVLTGNLVVFGGNVTLEEGSQVTGDVVLFGGTIDIAGEIKGGLLSFGGAGEIHNPATIRGDLTQFGGSIEKEPGATIVGEVFNAHNQVFDWDNPHYPFFDTFPYAIEAFNYPFVFSILWLLFVSLLMAALAIVIMLLFPSPTERIAHTAVSQVIVSWGLGFLTALVLPFLLVLLAITIVLIPITLVGFLGMAVAMFFGWIGIGYEIGHRFDLQLNMHLSAPVAAGFGTFVLTLLTFGVVKLVPCLGWMVPFMIIFPLGLGAVLLTRFGTQIYPPEDVAMTGVAISGVVRNAVVKTDVVRNAVVSHGEADNQALAIPPGVAVQPVAESTKSAEPGTPEENLPGQPENKDQPQS